MKDLDKSEVQAGCEEKGEKDKVRWWRWPGCEKTRVLGRDRKPPVLLCPIGEGRALKLSSYPTLAFLQRSREPPHLPLSSEPGSLQLSLVKSGNVTLPL